ncbi:hypothetical protein T4A_1816 [Trichinella pseudospiralis]|uniref:Uncharacterized protein n=1 Tax=Trichinella pseudospiralis TaxID=6337 RepID=A0A0V1AI34_TRIPS|nr:hypothetical protein T4A_1816 [Trichinella pseudospiralis]
MPTNRMPLNDIQGANEIYDWAVKVPYFDNE